MPRNLTDLMESAVSTAPPETHHASDITHLAERRQRRRTAFVAAGAALAVVAVAGATLGLTQHPPTRPQPADRFLHGQTVDAASAVPASTLPGYRREPWTVPSVQDPGHDLAPVPTYHDVDADGRLIVVGYVGSYPRQSLRARLFDGPGQGPRPLQQPPPLSVNGRIPVAWVPSFHDGQLLWTASGAITGGPATAGFHLTDLDGGHDVFVHTSYRQADVTAPWVSGDRVWFKSYDSATLKNGISYSLYTAGFSGPATKVASDVATATVADGVVAWVTTDGRLVTESAEGGEQHTITIPFDAGCHLPSTATIQGATGEQYLAVNRSVIALTEFCGTGKDQQLELLAFDLAGHPLVHVTGLYAISPSLGPDSLVFQGLVPPGFREFETLRYDLVTGTLARVGSVASKQMQAPRTAGDRVLWYDDSGGHVAEFTG